MKRISTKTETSNELPLDWCTVSYQPSVRHIKDKEVLENTKSMRISERVHVDDLKNKLAELKKQRLRFVETIPDIRELPLECPVCHKEGSPIIIKEKKANHPPEKYLRYNHTKGKPPCRIGKYIIKKLIYVDGKRTNKEFHYLILRKSLKPEDLILRKSLKPWNLRYGGIRINSL